jgi:putative transcriptional regulator
VPIRVAIDRILLERRMSVAELAGKIDRTPANLSILKTGRAKAIRFSTLNKLCCTLQSQPGDLLVYEAEADRLQSE